MPYIEHDGKRILFIHIPKTGGSSVENWMETLGPLQLKSPSVNSCFMTTPQHFRWQDIQVLYQEDYFDFVFSIVRDPYARAASEYRMRNRNRLKHNGLRFGTWLDRAMSRARHNPFEFDGHMRPQWEYIGDNTVVYKFEDGIDNILKDVASRMGLPEPKAVPHERPSDTTSLPVEWSTADRSVINVSYREDFEQFGYQVQKSSLIAGKSASKAAAYKLKSKLTR
ncbi:sulfotransferase family 2 domain-containing protein [Aliiroseovarius sp. F20344]|uniref:sulfotransferase family 2 domain-containing protein n=1 Tax=Aliiroseovarius sp. F20344 TaxID=2926414 RepID=UPI001FF2BE10|nr:sulfotransferase family protein [Aliiroseovarius sp. F20344]